MLYLTHIRLASHFWDRGKQCRPRSDAAERSRTRCSDQSLHCLLTYAVAASAADEIHFLGDFNINLLSDETQSRTWSHSLEAFDFSQLVKEPTRGTAHSATLIDHVYTNQPDKITECFVPKIALSDHYPVCFTRHTSQLQTKKRNHNSIKYRPFTIFENSTFLEELNTEIEKFKCTQSD